METFSTLTATAFYCANCTVVPVAVEGTYCDGCVEDILAYLEQDQAEKENKLWDEYAEVEKYKHFIERY